MARRQRFQSVDQVQVQAEEIARELNATNPSYGFIEFIPAIMALIQVLIQMWQGCKNPVNPTPAPTPVVPNSSTTAQQYVESHWDNATETYDPRMFRRVSVKARQASRRNGKKLNIREAQDVSRVTLDHIRNGNSAAIEVAAAQKI